MTMSNCYLTYAAVLRVWYAGCLQMNEDKEVPGKLFSLKQPAQVRAKQEEIGNVSKNLCWVDPKHSAADHDSY